MIPKKVTIPSTKALNPSVNTVTLIIVSFPVNTDEANIEPTIRAAIAIKITTPTTNAIAPKIALERPSVVDICPIRKKPPSQLID